MKNSRFLTNKTMTLAYLIVILTLIIVVTPVAAITNGGEFDGDDHPYVGLAVFDDADGNPLWRCSGALLSPTLLLTAGHCTEPPAVRATVWFEADVEAGIPENGYPHGGSTSVDGTAYTHPQYDPEAFYLYDLGVVILDEPVYKATYGDLAEIGVLDEFATQRGQQEQLFTVVGYGLQEIKPVTVQADRVRKRGTVQLVDVNGTAGSPAGTSVDFSSNQGQRTDGGTCFGDSGGPTFLPDTNIIVAVTSYGLNGNCEGISGGYRVDTVDDQEWLYGTFSAHLPDNG